jgi:hypothetical protein
MSIVTYAVMALGVASGAPRVAFDAGDALAGALVDAAELLDVDMDQLPRSSSLVPLGGSRPSRQSLPIPIPVRIPETMESAISKISAISTDGGHGNLPIGGH